MSLYKFTNDKRISQVSPGALIGPSEFNNLVGTPKIEIDPVISTEIKSAVEQLRLVDPNFFRDVSKIVAFHGNSFGQVSSENPSVIHLNVQKIKEDVKSKFGTFDSNNPEHREAFEEAVKHALVEVISHEKGHVCDWDPEKHQFPGGESAAEREVQMVMPRVFHSSVRNFYKVAQHGNVGLKEKTEINEENQVLPIAVEEVNLNNIVRMLFKAITSTKSPDKIVQIITEFEQKFGKEVVKDAIHMDSAFALESNLHEHMMVSWADHVFKTPEITLSDLEEFYALYTVIDLLGYAPSGFLRYVFSMVDNLASVMLRAIYNGVNRHIISYLALGIDVLKDLQQRFGSIDALFKKIRDGKASMSEMLEYAEAVDMDENWHALAKAAAGVEKMLPANPGTIEQLILALDHLMDLEHHSGLILGEYVGVLGNNNEQLDMDQMAEILTDKSRNWTMEDIRQKAPKVYNALHYLKPYRRSKLKGFTKTSIKSQDAEGNRIRWLIKAPSQKKQEWRRYLEITLQKQKWIESVLDSLEKEKSERSLSLKEQYELWLEMCKNTISRYADYNIWEADKLASYDTSHPGIINPGLFSLRIPKLGPSKDILYAKTSEELDDAARYEKTTKIHSGPPVRLPTSEETMIDFLHKIIDSGDEDKLERFFYTLSPTTRKLALDEIVKYHPLWQSSSLCEKLTKTAKHTITIGIDIDGVIADTHNTLMDLAAEEIPIDAEDRKKYRIEDVKGGSPELRGRVFQKVFERQSAASAPAIPHAVEKINEIYDAGHRVVLITARPKAWKAQTEKWLKKMGLKHHKLIFCSNEAKAGKAIQEGVKVFIEDKPENLQSISERGIAVYAYDQPWNKDVDFPRITDWRKVRANRIIQAQYSSETAYEWQQALKSAVDKQYSPRRKTPQQYFVGLSIQVPTFWQEILIDNDPDLSLTRNHLLTQLIRFQTKEHEPMINGKYEKDNGRITIFCSPEHIQKIIDGDLETIQEVEQALSHEYKHAADEQKKSKEWHKHRLNRPKKLKQQDYSLLPRERSAIEAEIKRAVLQLKEQGYPMSVIKEKVKQRFYETRGYDKDPRIETMLDTFIDTAHQFAGLKGFSRFAASRWSPEEKNRLKELYLKYRERGYPHHIIYKAAAYLLGKTWLGIKQKLESMYNLDEDLKPMKYEQWDKEKIDQTLQDLYRTGKPISRLSMPATLMYQITNHSMPKAQTRGFPIFYDSFDHAVAGNILAVGLEREGDKLTERPIKTLEDALRYYRRQEKMSHAWSKDEIVSLLRDAHVAGLPLTHSFFKQHPDIYRPLLGVGRSLEGLKDSVKRTGYTWDALVIEAAPEYIDLYDDQGKLKGSTEEIRIQRFLEINNIPFRVATLKDRIAVKDPSLQELGYKHFVPDIFILDKEGNTQGIVEVFGSIADSAASNTAEIYREKRQAKESFYKTLPYRFIAINNNSDGIDLTDEILRDKFSYFMG